MDTTKTEKMFALVDTWRQSGKTRKAFCSDHGLPVSTLSYWVTRKNKVGRSGEGFLPIDVSGLSYTSVEIAYPNGVTLRLSACDAQLIRQLVTFC